MYRAVALLLAVGFAHASSVSSPQELMKEAIEAQSTGNFELAIRDYKQILASYPNIPEIRSNLGAAYAGGGHYPEAIAEYGHSLKLKPNPQVQLNLALAYYKLGDLSGAVQNLKAVHEKDATNLQALTLLADCYLQLGQNKEVVSLLTSAQKADPTNATFNYLLGTALVRNGQAAEGQLLVDKILRNGDSAEARMLMGTTKYMAKDFAGSLAEFQQAVALNPNLPDLYSYYGMALLVTGDQIAAKKAFERELQTDPNNFESNLRMGVLLRQDEDNENALKYLKQALQIRPGDPGVRYQIASLELVGGQVEAACHDLEILTKDSPDFLEAHVSLATAYFRLKKKADGERGAGHCRQVECSPSRNKRSSGESSPMSRAAFLVLPALAFSLAVDAQNATVHTQLPARVVRECASCHPNQAKPHPATSMAHAMELPAECTILKNHPSLQFQDGAYSYRIVRQGDDSIYSVTDGQHTLTVPLGWAFGLGVAGQTYVFEKDGELYESRVSFYDSLNKLDLTMGAQNSKPTNLLQAAGRFMGHAEKARCFSCHATNAVIGTNLKVESMTPGVQCERCHGSTENHLIGVKGGNAALTKMTSLKKMSSEETSNFCGQCHRRGMKLRQVERSASPIFVFNPTG